MTQNLEQTVLHLGVTRIIVLGNLNALLSVAPGCHREGMVLSGKLRHERDDP